MNDSSTQPASAGLTAVAAMSLPRYYYPSPAAASTTTTKLTTTATTTTSLSAKDIVISKRRKELFGDCALIEIIHLHDCLRGALNALQEDVTALTQQIVQDFNQQQQQQSSSVPKSSFQTTKTTTTTTTKPRGERTDTTPKKTNDEWIDLERRVAGRFKVIWSVFRAHSSAEDEFIWPALRSKMNASGTAKQQQSTTTSSPQAQPKMSSNPKSPVSTCGCGAVTTGLVQEEYEEDHADEERMFSDMDALLTSLRGLINPDAAAAAAVRKGMDDNNNDEAANIVARKISERTRVLADHLMRHLEKEETQCMPLVVKHLSKAEIHDLVGNIMGKRSADTIAQIMTMAVQSLAENERQEMIQYMKQSMQNTFFDRWLNASGWGQLRTTTKSSASLSVSNTNNPSSQSTAVRETERDAKPAAVSSSNSSSSADDNISTNNREKRLVEEEQSYAVDAKRVRSASLASAPSSLSASPSETVHHPPDVPSSSDREQKSSAAALSVTPAANHHQRRRPIEITSQAELEKLIRAIVSNPGLTPQQKQSTIQGLRDSVWKSNQREKQRRGDPDSPPIVAVNGPVIVPGALPFLPHQHEQAAATAAAASTNNIELQQRPRVGLPPSAYYKKTGDSTVELIWKNDGMTPSRGIHTGHPLHTGSVPLFSAAELAPTFHDGAAGAVLGCPHYARACKLRHPKSGRLYTCRLCCDQARELPMIRGGSQDEKLDRYAVTEVMCMTCNTLQPAEDRCIHPDCESRGKPFAKYFCRICHLYDDGTRPIFHCPYCNTCRLGLGLGIDFRHCMRCNACVSLDDTEHHCIPQKLQGTCPICHDTLFQSTEPLRGLKCGHVMHMTCFTQYRRTSYTCPLCMRSMEDMKDHFALLDAAIRMQPMPATFLYTMSNLYCQDCGKTGQVQYHFVGQKCPHCSSYNTREMGRVHKPPTVY